MLYNTNEKKISGMKPKDDGKGIIFIINDKFKNSNIIYNINETLIYSQINNPELYKNSDIIKYFIDNLKKGEDRLIYNKLDELKKKPKFNHLVKKHSY